MYKNSIAIALVAAVVSAQGQSGKSIDKRQDNQDGNGNGNAYGRDPDFKTWAAKNNRHFKNTAEMTKREKNFAASTQKVANLRKKYPKTQFALNKFADLDDEEKDKMKGLDVSRMHTRSLAKKDAPIDTAGRQLAKKDETIDTTGRQLQSSAPSINWQTTGHMTPVKDQGYCGSCWAFNSSSVLEAKISIMQTSNNGGSLVPPVRLSEQEAVDCSTEYGNLGCDGGWPSNYWFYVYYEGAVSHDDYKYEGVDQNCKRDSSMDRIAEVWDWNDVGQNDQTIANALQEGPLSIAVMVEGDAWDYYSGGVMPVDDCTTPSVNHAMVLVGYESGEGSGSEDIWVPPTDDVWVPGTDPVWVPGGDEFVPASLDYCRRSRSEERDAGKCAGNLSSFNFDLTMCCKLGDEEQTISGGDGYWIPGEDGYWIPGEEGYWIPGEGSSGSGEAVWIFQNSWGSDWGENGNVRIPVEVGDGPGHCQVQAFVEDVIAM